MLPEKLSNGLCSLRPNEDKCTFSAVFELDKKGKIIKEWFGRTLIHSDRRFAYEDAQVLIEHEGSSEDPYEPVIKDLNRIAKTFRDARFKHGSVNFDSTELRFLLDEDGKPIAVYPRERKDAHKLIEEFMLLANRKVAEFIGKQKKTFIYRIHDEPNEDKLFGLQNVISKFGYSLNLKSKQDISTSLNKLLVDHALNFLKYTV